MRATPMRDRLLGFGALLITISACTPVRSALKPPYPLRGACLSAPQIESLARDQCAAAYPGRPLPSHPFTTDGCTLWPNGSWTACCIDHDTKYWCGGPNDDRLRADRALRSCVRGQSNALNATLMYAAVRLGGIRWSPFPWRWGYGFDWGKTPAAATSRATGLTSPAGADQCPAPAP